jgi:hypothetical protein
MLLFKRIFVLSLALILSIAPARAALGPDSIPAAFDELLKAASLSNPAMINISVDDFSKYIANKHDLPGALSPSELASNFYPTQDAADRTRVFPVNAISGQGLDEAVMAAVDEAIRNMESRRP